MAKAAKPSWMTFRVMPQHNPGIPAMNAAEEKAYCKVWGFTYQPRVTPEIKLTAPHPRSYKPNQGHAARSYRTLPGQTAFA